MEPLLKTPYLRLRFEKPESGTGFSARDIVSAVSREYKSGQLPIGSRLPPVRVLQHQLGISKNTAQVAYFELVSQGILENRNRLGYFILPTEKLQKQIETPRPASPILFRTSLPPIVASKGKSKSSKNDPISLGSVFISQELLPMQRIAECFRSVLKAPGLHYLYDQKGFAPLREIIAKRLLRRGIPAKAEDVIVTTGSQQALDIVTRSLQRRSIATENPAYGLGKLLFEMNQMEVTGLPLDPFKGIDLLAWRKRIAEKKPAALYLTTNFHNPTGYSYTTAELMEILRLSQEFGFGIIEDDWGSDMLSFSEFKPPLRSLGGEDILYMNSFTKKLLPSLRIGYLLANEKTRETLLTAKRVATLANPTLIEAALFEFLDRGYYDTHLRTLQKELDARYQACLETLAAVMPPNVTWTTPGGGPILWLEFPKRINLQALSDRMKLRNVHIDMRTQEWFFGEPHLHGTKIGYAQSSISRLKEALEILAQEIRRAMA